MKSAIQSEPARAGGTLAYLPVALFGSIMGLSGLAVSWRIAHQHFGTPVWIADAVSLMALASFALLLCAYLIKLLGSFDQVKAEFVHPIAGNMFGTLAISLLLIPLLLADNYLFLARLIWCIGAGAMLLLAWLIVTRWISVRQQPLHATPAWIVPVVGMIDIPLAVPALGWTLELHQLMVFATAVGLFFAVPLFTIILSRLMFEESLPGALQPSLLILVAPFSVGFSAYLASTGAVDGFATALYMLMLFILAVLLTRLYHLRNCCPFRVSWWAVSFPLASSAVAALKYATFAPSLFTDIIAISLLALASLIILFSSVTRWAKGLQVGGLVDKARLIRA